eukprot:SM000078S22084  [mRNA]  locus=s78:305941:307019:+ [translate_table: standard]
MPFAQPPIPLYGVAGKYAGALYVAAAKAKEFDKVEKELLGITEAAKKDEKLRSFLKDPSVERNVRLKAIEELAKAAGFSTITKNFLLILAENGRLRYLEKIAEAYEELLTAHRGQVKAVVTAALELESHEISEIKEALKSFIKPGQTLLLQHQVDRSILGGLVIDIGDRHIDLSIDSSIKKVEQMLGSGY